MRLLELRSALVRMSVVAFIVGDGGGVVGLPTFSEPSATPWRRFASRRAWAAWRCRGGVQRRWTAPEAPASAVGFWKLLRTTVRRDQLRFFNRTARLPERISPPAWRPKAMATFRRSQSAHSRVLWILLCLGKATQFSPVNQGLFESCAAHYSVTSAEPTSYDTCRRSTVRLLNRC